jgi:4-hydroxybenzoate polyprenyltransferase
MSHLQLTPFLSSLVFAQYLCFCLYSLPPFRLKKNRFIALVLDAIYSGTLFNIICFNIFNSNTRLTYLLIFWSFLKGLRNIISHIIADKENDKLIQVVTIANTIEIKKIINYSYLLLVFEILTFMTGLLVYKLWVILVAYFLFIIYWQFRDNYVIPFLYKRKEPIIRNQLIDFNYFYEFFFPILLFILVIKHVDEKYIYAFPLIILNLKFLRLFK